MKLVNELKLLALVPPLKSLFLFISRRSAHQRIGSISR